MVIPDEEPVFDGYGFYGWRAVLSDGSTRDFKPGDLYNLNDSRTVWAIWGNYVHYDLNGGSGEFEDFLKEKNHNKKLSESIPEREGYEFLGWSTIEDPEQVKYQPGDEFTENGVLTLYAVWKKTSCKLTFISGIAGALISPVTVGYNKSYAPMPVVSREGYIFAGWYAQRDNWEKITEDTLFTDDTILFAQWELERYSIALDLNLEGLSTEPTCTSVLYGSTFENLPIPENTDEYLFDGWYTEPEGGIEVGENTIVTDLSTDDFYEITISGNTVKCEQILYAHWYKYEFLDCDHSIVKVEASPPTVDEDGNKEYWYCEFCGTIFADTDGTEIISYEDIRIPAIGQHDHIWSDETVINKEATCTENGLIIYTCSICGEEKAEEIAALGHDWETVFTVDKNATCTEKGSRSHHCSRCKEINDVEEIPAIGHKWDDGTVTTEPTCTNSGLRTYTCSVCGDTYAETIPETGHTWDEGKVTREATIELPGIRTFTCTVCGATKTYEIPYEHIVHSYEDTVVKPTCTHGGYTLHTCIECGYSYKDNVTEATGHSFTNYVSNGDAACEKDGTKTAKCDHGCGAKDTITDEGSALRHVTGEPKIENKVDATCTKDGSYDEITWCRVCGKELSRQTKIIEAAGHMHGTPVKENIKDATCEVAGSYDEVVYCSVCKEEISRKAKTIAALGHKWYETYIVDKEASCTEEGSESIHCSVCGKVKENSAKAIEKKNHEYGEWKTVKEATTTATGLKERTCKNCGTSKQEEIAKIVPPAPSALAVPTVIPAEISPSNPIAVTSVEKQITTAESDADPKGSVFNLLQAKGVAKSNTSIKISWTKVAGAKSYIIYGNKCGASNQFKKIATVTGTSFTHKKLTKGTYYKYLIVAVNGEKALSTSKTIHVATKGGKVGNSKSITTKAKKNKVSLKKGKTFKLGAKAVAQSKKLKVKKHRTIAYESSNKKIATVSGKGVIKAAGKGTCYVFAYAQNGVCKKIKVTVQ